MPRPRPASPRRTLQAALLLAALLGAAALPAQDELARVRGWFAEPRASGGTPPDAAQALSRDDVAKWLPQVLQAWRDGAPHPDEAALAPPHAVPVGAPEQELRIGDSTMPYVFFQKGAQPAGGWPLYLCLHGGGADPQAAGPHAFEVNTSEWRTMRTLAERLYPSPGLYFVPRMPDDRQGRWWFRSCQRAFDAVIRTAIRRLPVDPDRVYLLGISEGGYGAIRFAGNAPDRFAACNAMAAAEPLATSPPETMRNVALRIDIGGRDTMFDRIGLARTMAERLTRLHAGDRQGYVFELAVQAGRGHGIDYRPGPRWLVDRARDPTPARIVWTVQPFHDAVPRHCYWLAVPEPPERLPLYLTATLREQGLELTAEQDDPAQPGQRIAARGIRLVLRLDDRHVDLDRPLSLRVNGAARPDVAVERRLATMLRTLDERGDGRFCHPAEVSIEL
ncbi:MAG: hypothetical protein JNL12_08900 [Planctomycetes bacterium]|nr:hypothetical protein [Planctomycetota bacterium]